MENQTNNMEEGDKTLKLVNVGATLRSAREQAGLSVADIADRIKFASRQVEALEANDFTHLPQAPFLRGFVRSYARVLQLDEASLLGSLPEAPVKQEVAASHADYVPFQNPLAMSRGNLLWLGGSLGVALLLVLFLMLPESQEVKMEPVLEAVTLPASETAASGAVATDQPGAWQIKLETPVVEKRSEAAKQIIPEKKVLEVRTTVALPQVSAASAPATTLTAIDMLKRRPMHLVFTGDTWVEVLDTNGEIMLSRSNPAGTEKWIGGPKRAPYDVTITHPERVRLYYKGREIDLSAYAGKGVAHFKVE